jgi:hypothetical protein
MDFPSSRKALRIEDWLYYIFRTSKPAARAFPTYSASKLENIKGRFEKWSALSSGESTGEISTSL